MNDTAADRETYVEELSRRLDAAMGFLGLVFAAVVLAETFVPARSAAAPLLAVAGWVLWSVFLLEFLLRMFIAPSVPRFLRRNWWQILFLALPFLRLLRVLRAARIVRGGRVLSWAVRTGRTAARRLTGRIAWLGAVTVIVVLASAQLLYEFSGFTTYVAALHAAALATVTGEPIPGAEGLARVMEVVLAVYSVVVFATLAGAVGAYFLERRSEPPRLRTTRTTGARPEEDVTPPTASASGTRADGA